MEFESVLDEAKHITGNDRMEQYGHPEKNFKVISELWNEYLVHKYDVCPLKPEDVCFMMILLKMAREITGSKRDNLVDIAGYVRNVMQIRGEE